MPYEADSANVESVSLGTSQAFVSKTPLYTHLFELNDISSEQPPLMADQTATVPELIPAALTAWCHHLLCLLFLWALQVAQLFINTASLLVK